MNMPPEEARAIAFLTIVFAQLVHSFSCRDDRKSIFTIGISSNISLVLAATSSVLLQLAVIYLPVVHDFFGITVVTAGDLAVSAAMAFVPLVVVEFYKAVLRRLKVLRKSEIST